MDWHRPLSAYISSKTHQEQFSTWAFGENYQEITHFLDIVIRWNNLHKDILEINPDGHISSDLTKMINLWKNNQNIE